MIKSPRWTQRPANSTWGDWGVDDQLGRLNLIGEEQRLRALAEVKDGRSFCLSLPLDLPANQVLNKVRQPPLLRPVIRNNASYFNFLWQNHDRRITDIGCDDFAMIHLQYSTQWDSLAHRGSMFEVFDDGIMHPVYYNGFKAGEHVVLNADNTSSANSLGIENMACHGVQGRAVLVDLHSECGDYPQTLVGYDHLMRTMESQKIDILSGDILCLWTGLDIKIFNNVANPDPRIRHSCAVLDGFDQNLLNWITDSQISCIVSDNIAVEAVGQELPDDYIGSSLPLHEHCLFKLGVHLGELWCLHELAVHLRPLKRSSFFLTAPPLRLPGAVGSPVTPIALT